MQERKKGHLMDSLLEKKQVNVAFSLTETNLNFNEMQTCHVIKFQGKNFLMSSQK